MKKKINFYATGNSHEGIQEEKLFKDEAQKYPKVSNRTTPPKNFSSSDGAQFVRTLSVQSNRRRRGRSPLPLPLATNSLVYKIWASIMFFFVIESHLWFFCSFILEMLCKDHNAFYFKILFYFFWVIILILELLLYEISWLFIWKKIFF